MSGNDRLFLIDGNSVLYRSYYAIQRLSNSRGFPTNAIYGFINTLRKILDQEAPAFLGIVFDVRGPTVRHDLFTGYKSNRRPMPDDLRVQLPKLKDVLGALNIPLFEFEGYEADDVLATLARKAAAAGVRTVIVTTDKDLFQLIDDRTLVYNPAKETFIDAANLREVFGVEPGQVADVLALWGDATDNIPGVPGIGEKTAKTLIREHGSLEALLRDLPRLGNPRLREKISENLEALELSRRLVALEAGLDVAFELEAFRRGAPDAKEAVRLFQELEFASLAAEFVRQAKPGERRFRAVFDEAELADAAARAGAAGVVGLDTSTDGGPGRPRLVGLSLGLAAGETVYVPLRHDYMGAPDQIPAERAMALLRPILEDPAVRKCGQDLKADTLALAREGVRLAGLDKDSMVLSYLLEPNWGKHNIEKLALAYRQETVTTCVAFLGKGRNQITMSRAEVDRVAPYACQDADLAFALAEDLWERVKGRGLDRLYEAIERPLIGVLARMEEEGVRVDREALTGLARSFERDLAGLETRIYELAGGEFNINSPKQLGEVLFHKLGLRPTKRTRLTKGFSTAVDVLEELALTHPLADLVLKYRTLAKLKSGYADALPALIDPETGRIHTSYNQTVAATGRLSSSDPNLQNIPARGEWGPLFRRTFIAAEGRGLLAADYSQIELRLLAHLSEDPGLIDIFLSDRDVHAETARQVFGDQAVLFAEEMRRRAKIINFSIIYGTSAFSLAKELGTSTSEAQAFMDRYFERYPKVRDYLDRIVEEARETGISTTLFGRQRQVPELRQDNRAVREAGRRIALNNPIQGGAADIIKLAMIRIHEALESRALAARMILQVHDELVFEAPEAERDELSGLVREIMEGACDLVPPGFPGVRGLRVPLKVRLGWGSNWADAK